MVLMLIYNEDEEITYRRDRKERGGEKIIFYNGLTQTLKKIDHRVQVK
jgi:hypothetical protein